MQSAQDRLKFAVEFARKDLGTQREGDLLNLRDDLGSFIIGVDAIEDRGGILAMLLNPPYPKDYTREHFERLQTEVKEILNQIVDSREKKSRTRNLIPIRGHFATMAVLGSPNRTIPLMTGPTRDVFLFVLIHLLGQESTDRIMRCADSECFGFFYRVKKQRFCSEKCYMRVFMKNKRAEEKSQKRTKAPNKKGAKKKRRQ